MKLAVFDDFRIGTVSGDTVRDITSILPTELDDWPELRMNWLIRQWPYLQARLDDGEEFPALPLADVRLRAVNPAPPQLFAIPANFREHIGELGDRAVTAAGSSGKDARFFLKAAGSMSGRDDGILLPRGSSRRFDHECELGVVIGRGGVNIRREDALGHVFGYTCLIDMTMRIEKGVHEEDRSLRKSFTTFTPTGPFLVTADEVPDPSVLRSRLSVNGELRQSAEFEDMIVPVDEAIELISSVVHLQPGDVIASGTPKGVGPVNAGDDVTIEIDGVGAMTLRVGIADEAPRPF